MKPDMTHILATCYALFRQNEGLKQTIDAIADNEGVASKVIIERAVTEYAMRNSSFPRMLAAGVTTALLDSLKAWIADREYVKAYVLKERGEEEPRPDDTDETYLKESMAFPELTMRLALLDFRTMLEKHLRESFK
jgi:hypothetical protein